MYKRQHEELLLSYLQVEKVKAGDALLFNNKTIHAAFPNNCLLYTSDAADERSSVDLGGRRIIKKKKILNINVTAISQQKTNQHT